MKLITLLLIITLPAFGQTYEDSLLLYKNSVSVMNFYERQGTYKVIRKTAYFEDPTKLNRKARKAYDHPLKYYDRIDGHRYYQREQEHQVINKDAPMQLFDDRIEPVMWVMLRDPLGNGKADEVGVYLYAKPKKTVTKELFDRQEVIVQWVEIPNVSVILSPDNKGRLTPVYVQNKEGERLSFADNINGKFQYPE